MTTTLEQNGEEVTVDSYEEEDVENVNENIGTNSAANGRPDKLPIFKFISHEKPKTEEQAHGVDALKHDEYQCQQLVRIKGLSYFAVLLNFLKSLIGAGFLSLPLAFSSAGPWSALALLLVSAVLNCFCMMQLVKCTQFHYKRLNISYLSYGNLAKEACRSSFPWMRRWRLIAQRLVNFSILLLEFGFCSTYYLFIAVSLKEVSAVLLKELLPDHSMPPSVFNWLIIIYVPMVLMSFIRSLRILSFFSFVGNVLMMTSLVFILYTLAADLSNNLAANQRGSLKIISNSFSGLLIASGTIIFSFEAQTLVVFAFVLPLEKKLKKPKQMLGLFGILSSGILISSIVYVSVGFLGYLRYGACVHGSITQNLGPTQMSTILVKLALCVSVCSCFLLQMYVIIEVLWPPVSRMIIEGENFKKTNAKADQQKRWWQFPANFKFYCELCFRTLMVTVCFSFAAAVPHLDDIIPLVGSTSGMLLAFVYPALIDLFTFVPLLLEEGRRQKAHIRLCQNILLAFVGLFGMVAGLIASITKLAETKHENVMCTDNNSVNTTIIPMFSNALGIRDAIE